MNISRYQHLIPQIEDMLADLRPDALVMGLGPTAWLVPWVDQSLLTGVRLFGAHDAFRVLPVDDLILFDAPELALHPDCKRHEWIVNARPKRLWVLPRAWEMVQMRRLPDGTSQEEKRIPMWSQYIVPAVQKVMRLQDWAIWEPPQNIPPDRVRPKLDRKKPDGSPLPDTLGISPTGCTTLAWTQGCRRIGVIGTDMMDGHHRSHALRHQCDAFFCRIAEQAHERGGVIRCLSPITSMERFKSWDPRKLQASGSAPIAGNGTPEPKPSLNTASESTAASRSTSDGCEAEIPASR